MIDKRSKLKAEAFARIGADIKKEERILYFGKDEIKVPCDRCGLESGTDLDGTTLVLFGLNDCSDIISFSFCPDCSKLVGKYLKRKVRW